MKDKWLTQYDGKSDKQTEVLLCQKNTHPVFFFKYIFDEWDDNWFVLCTKRERL